MKLKTLKNHYYDGKYRNIGSIYMADKNHGEAAVRNGLCEQVKQLTRKDKQKARKPKKSKK